MGRFGDRLEKVGGEGTRKAFEESPFNRDLQKARGLAKEVYNKGVATVDDIAAFKAENHRRNAQDRGVYHQAMADMGFGEEEGPMTREEWMRTEAEKHFGDQSITPTTLDMLGVGKAATSLKEVGGGLAKVVAKKKADDMLTNRDLQDVRDMVVKDTRIPDPQEFLRKRAIDVDNAAAGLKVARAKQAANNTGYKHDPAILEGLAKTYLKYR